MAKKVISLRAEIKQITNVRQAQPLGHTFSHLSCEETSGKHDMENLQVSKWHINYKVIFMILQYRKH